MEEQIVNMIDQEKEKKMGDNRFRKCRHVASQTNIHADQIQSH